MTTKEAAVRLGISRGSVYYKKKKPGQDWQLKCRIEEVLREHPSYGSRRLALHFKLNRKRLQRVMRFFGIRPYRRRAKRWRHAKVITTSCPNLLLGTYPAYPNHIWASDFTHLCYHKKVLHLCTVLDLCTKQVVRWSLLTTHTTQLTLSALFAALQHHPHPAIFHSDNGREYVAKDFMTVLHLLGIQPSRSKKGCPWENGYQESFYSHFKLELGDPGRFATLGELVYEIHRAIYAYNTSRIHSALKMPPAQFALHQKSAILGT